MRGAVARCVVANFLAFGPGLATAQTDTTREIGTLQELGRFEARFPETLEYDATTCTLWISGTTGIVRRVGLQGAGVSTHDSGQAGPIFVSIVDGDLVAYSHHGAAARLSMSEGPVRVPGLFTVANGLRYVGGDSRDDGTLVVAAASEDSLRLFRQAGRRQMPFVRSFGPLEQGFHYTGVTFDPVTRDTWAVATDGTRSLLRVFDEELHLQSEQLLATRTGVAQGLAMQHETGDIFISYVQRGRVVGEVVRYAVTPVDAFAEPLDRPVFECLVS